MGKPVEEQSPHAQIVELINRYFAAIDDKCLDFVLAESTFAPAGKMVRPNGAETVGPAAICEGQNESFARFRATQHVMTNHVVDLVGEHARMRANVIATHLWAPGQGDPVALESHFTAGGVITVEVVRLARGWRITRLENRVVWRTGSGFVQMLATGSEGPKLVTTTLDCWTADHHPASSRRRRRFRPGSPSCVRSRIPPPP